MRWWYSHLIFPAQYVSFKDAGEEELFWNIVTWYHFFNHYKDFVCKIQWYYQQRYRGLHLHQKLGRLVYESCLLQR